MWRYDRAFGDNRVRLGQHSGVGLKFLKAVAKNFVLLQLLFLVLFSWLMGSLYQQSSRTHRITIGFVDYDGGAIGEAVRVAYGELRADTFPTLVEVAPRDLPTPDDLRASVCRTQYWGGLYVAAGASVRLREALAGGPPATAYDPTDKLGLIWNEARYSAIVDAAVLGTMQTLSQAARVAYSRANGTGQVQGVTSVEALSVFAAPWTLTSVNLKPTSQGTRAVYNTMVIVLVLIQEFFYLGTVNGIYAKLKIWSKIHPVRIIIVRSLNSLLYCFVGSLCVTGMVWAFRADWDVNGAQFVLTWMALWLFAHLNFQTLDVFTVWLPVTYVPMSLISWVVVNVTSILLPLELSPGFYRIGYIFPAHEIYQTLLDIWSEGCNPKLRYSVPILFAWEIASFFLCALGVMRRSHYAVLGEEEQARQNDERLRAALEFERDQERKHREQEKSNAEQQKDTGEAPASAADAEERRKLGELIDKENAEEHRLQRRMSKTVHYGPAFTMPFVSPKDSDDSDEP